MNRQLWEDLFLAAKGGVLWKWLRILHKIGKKDTAIFLIEQDQELNKYACIYMKNLLHRNHSQKVFLLSPYQNVLRNLPIKVKSSQKIPLGRRKCEAIKKYYQLVKFSNYVYFISMGWPESNLLYRFLGKHGIDRKDMVCLGLYKLREVPGGKA